LATLEGHTSPVYGVALSADGRVLASGSWDRTLRLWQTPSASDGELGWQADSPAALPKGGQLLATLHGHTGGVRSVALSANGRLLASGSWDGTIRLWQAPEGRPLATLRGHTGGGGNIAPSAHGR